MKMYLGMKKCKVTFGVKYIFYSYMRKQYFCLARLFFFLLTLQNVQENQSSSATNTIKMERNVIRLVCLVLLVFTPFCLFLNIGLYKIFVVLTELEALSRRALPDEFIEFANFTEDVTAIESHSESVISQ